MNGVETDAAVASKKELTTALNGFSILRLIHSARQTYGLRTADYARYHRHCTRKIRSLRIATNSTHKNAKNGRRAAVEYAAPSSSKSLQSSTKQAKPEMRVINTPFSSRTKDVTAALVGKDARHLQILLWEAERAWAEGMRSREELAPLERSANEQSSRTSSLAAKRHRVLKRLQKAASHAQHLVTVVREVPPAELSDASSTRSGVQLSILQAGVYKLYMQGTAAFVALTMTNSTSSREAAAHALQLLSVAYILLDAQAESASNVTDSAIAAEFIDELEPMIRFCARSAQLDGQQASILELAKDQMIAALRRTADGLPFQDASATLTTFREVQSGSSGVHKAQRTVQNLREIKWRGIEIPIRNAELARVLSKALSSLAAVGTSTGTSGRRRKMRHAKSGHSASILAMYDRALALLSDSEVCARSLVEENRLALLRAQSARFEASRKPLLQVHEYITFQLLVLRVQRDNLLLRRKLHKLEKRSTNANADRRTQLKNKQGGLQHLPNVLKLLDGILQSLQQARNLQIVEEDVFDLAEQVENRLSLEKARRCLYLAHLYSTMDRPDAGLLLLQKSTLYARPLNGSTTASAQDIEPQQPTESGAGVERMVIADDEIATLLRDVAEMTEALQLRWYDSSRVALSTSQTSNVDGVKTFDVAYNYIASTDIDSIRNRRESDGALEHAADTFETSATPTNHVSALEDLKITQLAATQARSGGGSSIWSFFGRSSSKQQS